MFYICINKMGIVGNNIKHIRDYMIFYFKIIPNLSIIASKEFEELGQRICCNFKYSSYPRERKGSFKFIKH